MVSELDSAQRGQGLFAKLGGGGNLAMDWHPVQGRQVVSLCKVPVDQK